MGRLWSRARRRRFPLARRDSRSTSTRTSCPTRASSARRPTATCSWPRARPGDIQSVAWRHAPTAAPTLVKRFATGLKQPFGMAFYPPGDARQWVYVANTDSVVRFPYQQRAI